MTAVTEMPTDEELDAFRHVGDVLADATIAEISRRRMRGHPVASLEQLAGEGHDEARTLWEHVHTVPEWVDFDAMEPAFRIALQNVIPSGLALMAGSLIESYASGRGAKVLVATGRLRTDTLRRLFETAKFASDLALHRGARPENPAWRNVVAVRLMHARVRQGLRDRPDWDRASWGLPVNQEDYASTLFMFSLVYRRGLERLGVRLTEAEHVAAHSNWRYVGWLMGIDPALLSTNIADESRRYASARRRNFDPDGDSRALAHGLLDAMARQPPFFLSRVALHQLSRTLIGDELADALALEESAAWRTALRGGAIVAALNAGLARRVDPVSVWVGEQLTRGIVVAGLPGGTRFE